jgi:hypothetical protein
MCPQHSRNSRRSKGTSELLEARCSCAKTYAMKRHLASECYFDSCVVYSCAVRVQNIDTDQIIPAEYLTLVPSKVRASPCAQQLNTLRFISSIVMCTSTLRFLLIGWQECILTSTAHAA